MRGTKRQLKGAALVSWDFLGLTRISRDLCNTGWPVWNVFVLKMKTKVADVRKGLAYQSKQSTGLNKVSQLLVIG